MQTNNLKKNILPNRRQIRPIPNRFNSPCPKDILLQQRYLWEKENYLTLCRYEINNPLKEKQNFLWP